MVNIPMANVRSGPGTTYKVLWKLEKYHPLKVIKTKGDWYYFEDFEGDKAWIHKDIVSDEQSVIVIRDKCNVRSGPGENYGVIFTVERGVPFKVLNRKGRITSYNVCYTKLLRFLPCVQRLKPYCFPLAQSAPAWHGHPC